MEAGDSAEILSWNIVTFKSLASHMNARTEICSRQSRLSQPWLALRSHLQGRTWALNDRSNGIL
jgi:hypothetical protein